VSRSCRGSGWQADVARSIAKRKRLPTLNKAQENKLKHLTILSLAMENRVRPVSLCPTSFPL
jgi:hypothetical protein